MTRFHSRRLFGKAQNRLTEVISVCGKDVIFVSNKQAKTYVIRSNTGWIVMCGGSSADENEQFVHLAETALEENISKHVKGVIFSRPLADEKEYIPEAWKHNQEELTVYLPSSSEDFLEEDAIAGVALYHVKHSGSVLIDGLEGDRAGLVFIFHGIRYFSPGRSMTNPFPAEKTHRCSPVFVRSSFWKSGNGKWKTMRWRKRHVPFCWKFVIGRKWSILQ